MAMTSTPRDRIAAELRAAIARAGRRRNEVADAAGIHRQLLGRKLNGHTTVSMEDVASIARAIDVPPAELAAAIAAVA